MPLLVGFQGLHEAGAFFGNVGCLPGQQSRFLENTSGRTGESALQAGDKIAARYGDCLERLPEAKRGELKGRSPVSGMGGITENDSMWFH
jgi:hypothetical protein